MSSVPSGAPAATLTGQDVGEAEGALRGVLERVLTRTDSGLSRVEYIVLRVLAARGPVQSPAALHDYVAGQPQLGLDRSGVADLLRGLEARGLISGSNPEGPGPTALTAAGAALNATVGAAVIAATRRLYADLDRDELATTHRVLVELTQRANRLSSEL